MKYSLYRTSMHFLCGMTLYRIPQVLKSSEYYCYGACLLFFSGNKAKQPVRMYVLDKGPQNETPRPPFLAVDRPGGRQNSLCMISMYFFPDEPDQVEPDYIHLGAAPYRQPPCTCLFTSGATASPSVCRSEKAWSKGTRLKSMGNGDGGTGISHPAWLSIKIIVNLSLLIACMYHLIAHRLYHLIQ